MAATLSDESDDESDAELENLELEFPLEDERKAGKREYLQKCAELKIVPIALFIAKMEVEHILELLPLLSCAMAEVLSVNQTLTSLSLSSNRIGLPGAQALAIKLLVNSKLAELNMRSNELDDRAAAQLAASIASSTSLTRVDFSYNHFDQHYILAPTLA
ncbi:hypothetical protein T492DRAFT_887248 [Pavlovales sp. CCMP2436]|nr:hypothetical protein T492DRAFT_887248 [Pavlovales sp. CCMP2436]